MDHFITLILGVVIKDAHKKRNMFDVCYSIYVYALDHIDCGVNVYVYVNKFLLCLVQMSNFILYRIWHKHVCVYTIVGTTSTVVICSHHIIHIYTTIVMIQCIYIHICNKKRQSYSISYVCVLILL